MKPGKEHGLGWQLTRKWCKPCKSPTPLAVGHSSSLGREGRKLTYAAAQDGQGVHDPCRPHMTDAPAPVTTGCRPAAALAQPCGQEWRVQGQDPRAAPGRRQAGGLCHALAAQVGRGPLRYGCWASCNACLSGLFTPACCRKEMAATAAYCLCRCQHVHRSASGMCRSTHTQPGSSAAAHH